MIRAISSSRLSVLALVFCLAIALSPSAFGQAISGNLTGTVQDPTGAAVNGATVEVTNVATGFKTTAKTQSFGSYLFSELPAGTYNVTVSAPNFKTTTLGNIPVELNKANTANIKLELGSSTTTVEVSGVAAPVDTTTAQLQSNFNEQFAKDLPITSNGQGAGVLNLSMLAPGVSNANAMGLGVGPSVGGQRPRDNNFTVEGVDNNNKSVTGSLIMVPNDAVDSFSLISNQFNSEFGHSSGGQFNTTIKSGTNSFHGSLYEYFRNRKLNAVDQTYVNQGLTSNPRFDSNRFGGTFGGPIIKNKLFFFTNYEYQPTGLTASSSGGALTPTTAGLATIATDPNLSATNFAIFKQYVPVAAAQSNSCGTGGNQPCTIAYTINGTATQIPIGTVTITPPAFENYTNFVQSVDFNMSSNDQFRGRYVFNNQTGPDITAQLPVFFVNVPVKFRLFTLGEYHTFTPSLLNEIRLGFNRFAQTFPVGNQKYPGLDAFPNIVLSDLGSAGLNIGPDPNAPQYTIQNWYGIVDNASWTHGKHTVKFGVEWHEYISPQNFTQRSRGDYEYTNTQRFLDDISPDIIGQRSSGSTTYYGNQSAFYWYVNDAWKLKPNFTLSLGVRYEYTSIPIGEQRQALNAVSNSPSVIIPQVNAPLIFSKISAPKKNFMPRLGIAYSPGDKGTTSIRAGFGMAYDALYDNIGILSVPPQVGATNNVNLKNPPTTNFLGSGGLAGGGSGVTQLTRAEAVAGTSAWIPPNQKYPYSVNWNLGVQHSFGKNYTAEVNYVGTRGNHLDVQNILNFASVITPATALPTFFSMPTQATLDGLTNSNLAALESLNNVPANLNSVDGCPAGVPPTDPTCTGFNQSVLTAFLPSGWSTYHGLQAGLTRRFSNGLTLQSAYTWSHTIDNSTADFHSTDLTPRRQQDFFNFAPEKATSALSRTHRLTVAAVYSLPFFKGGNWFMKNVVGNWEFSPIYTFESPEFATVQAARDANLNGDSAGDRGILNPSGVKGTGGNVMALTALSGPNNGQTVAYVATTDSKGLVPCQSAAQCPQYIRTGFGSISNMGRNTLATYHTNNFDLGTYKDLNITERMKFRFGAQFGNLFNHPQYIPGSNPGFGLGVNDVLSYSSCCTTSTYRNFTTPTATNFNNPKLTFASNARTMGLVMKFIF
jgi:hypothetical protein